VCGPDRVSHSTIAKPWLLSHHTSSGAMLLHVPIVKHSARSRRLLAIAALAGLAALVIPAAIVLPRPSSYPEPYVFEAQLNRYLGASADGKLTYYEASTLDGVAPANTVAVSMDDAYTRGWSPGEIEAGDSYWMEGSLMTPEVFYGEQYIFWGPPQLYISQLKTGSLWPDQKSELLALYGSPVSTLAAPIQLPMLFRSDSFSIKLATVLLLRCVLIAAVLLWALRKRPGATGIVALLALYALCAILLSLPILGDLY